MATYAIGDVQGCFRTLQRLLARIAFAPSRDRLWLVGDLVNRGPRSADVLRWARRHEGDVVAVLGNHDLRLLEAAAQVRRLRRSDTFGDVLEAGDRDALLAWLRGRPLLHRERGYVLVHAGLLPSWSVPEAEALAREAEEGLRGRGHRDLLRLLPTHRESRWHAALPGAERLAVVVNALTRLRTCRWDGRMDDRFRGDPGAAPAGLTPWFSAPGRRAVEDVVLFGHWSALGLCFEPGVVGLDTGCVAGGVLTAIRLEDGALFQERLADR